MKVVSVALGLVVTFHLAATFLWIGPSNPIRAAVTEPLTDYMQPMFQQNWSLFAPTPIGVGYSLEVRAWNKNLETTDWVDVTAIEMTNLTHHVAPSRASRPTRLLASTARSDFTKLSPAEFAVLEDNYHHDAWARMEEAMAKADGGSGSARIRAVLNLDKVMTAYATEFVRATEADFSPRYVQFRVVAQAAPSFAARDGAAPEPKIFEFGRRPMLEFDNQDSPAFTHAIERFMS